MLRSLQFIFSLLLYINCTYCQPFVYSKNYFRWPVDVKPGIVANFGELRANHWHMGLDVRTDHKVNMPVYASADGYIAKVTVNPFGYGQAIYIDHPNGLTTVYGHLNKFFPKLDSFVTAQQYKQESWQTELDFTKDKFPVHKGQFIAYSGSTGSSQGPHVHFEIRDSKTGRCINPFFFDLPVPDDVPPVFTKLAMYDRNKSLYDQSPIVFTVKKIKNSFLLKDALIKTGFSKLSFGIGAYDCVSGSTNPNGIYKAKIFFDGQPLIEFVLDSMDYDETDYVNAHIDYRYWYRSGNYLQNLFKLPGDKGRAYRMKNNDGTIFLTDTSIHSVKIEIEDIHQNSSSLSFQVQLDDHLRSLTKYNAHDSFSPNFVNVFEQNDFEVYLPEDCLYDSIQPVFSRNSQDVTAAVSSEFQFLDPSIPFYDKINVRIRPDRLISEDQKSKIVIRRVDKKGTSYRNAEWQQGWLAAALNEFGSFQAVVDNVPPTVNELGHGDTVDLSPSKSIIFYPKDNSAIKNFRAELDGRWLRFTNDKGSAWIYNFDERCPFGVHQLKIAIGDIAGNVTTKQWWFKRYPYTPPKAKKKTGKKRTTNGKKKVETKKK